MLLRVQLTFGTKSSHVFDRQQVAELERQRSSTAPSTNQEWTSNPGRSHLDGQRAIEAEPGSVDECCCPSAVSVADGVCVYVCVFNCCVCLGVAIEMGEVNDAATFGNSGSTADELGDLEARAAAAYAKRQESDRAALNSGGNAISSSHDSDSSDNHVRARA